MRVVAPGPLPSRGLLSGRLPSCRRLTLVMVLGAGAALAQSGAVQNAAVQGATLQACTLPTGTLPTRTRAVFLIDTSGSMRGIGDGRANIFAAVTRSVGAYVEAARPDRLEVLTFDSGLKTRRAYDLPAALPQFRTDLAALRADGRNTHLYRSLRDALAPLPGAPDYATNIFVITDGIDNDPSQRVTAAQALSAYRERGPLDRLTYIALGTRIPREAVRALEASPYASGLTLTVGQAPDLLGLGLGSRVVVVRDPAHVPAPFADGTPLTLASGVAGLSLEPSDAAGGNRTGTDGTVTVQGGEVGLRAPSRLPYATPALLCAPPLTTLPGAGPAVRRGEARQQLVGARPRLALLSLQFSSGVTAAVGSGPSGGLRWLNPGANLALRPGQSVTLRFRADPDLPLDGPSLGLRLPATPAGGPTGLEATLERQPGAREFAVRLRHTGGAVAGVLTPQLVLGNGGTTDLPPVTLGTGTLAGASATSPSGSSTQLQQGAQDDPRAGGPRWVLLLELLVLLALLALVLRQPLRRPLGRLLGLLPGRARTPRPAPRPMPEVGGTPVPSVAGIQYGEDRLISLVSVGGEVSSVRTPLGGPFDLGLLGRVPLLSGLRAEQHLEGLRLLNIPGDIEASQGARLLVAGDVVRPGTLIGVAVAQAVRAPHAPLGSLVGLGLPLVLRTEGVTLRVCGPYGVHDLIVSPGITDLGEAFAAPALVGLKVSVSGPHILLADLPPGMALNRPGEAAPLRPGTYLPPESTLTLPKA